MPTPVQVASASAAVGGGALGGYLIANGLSGGGEKVKLPEELKKTPDVMQESDLQANSLLTFTKVTNLANLLKPIQPKEKQEWWDWAFKKKFSKRNATQLDSIFASVNSSYSDKPLTDGNSPKQIALNQACDDAYKQDKSKYLFENSHLLKNISDFCTIAENGFDISEPKYVLHKTTKTDNGYTDGVLSKNENVNKLVVKENTDNNDLWWKWAYEYLYKANKTDASETFKTIAQGYKDSGTDSLNNACDAAYKKPYLDLTKGNEKLLKDIKRFCSPNKAPLDALTLPLWKEPASPKTLKDASPVVISSGIGSKETNKEKLVDFAKSENKDWWDWSFTNRFPKNADEITKLPDVFKGVKSGYNAQAESGSTLQTSLNQACKVAYSKNKEEVNKPTNENKLKTVIKKFCSHSSVKGDLDDPDQ